MQAFPLWPVMCNTVFSLACSEEQQFKVSFAWNGCNQLIEISSGLTVLISFALRIMNPASCVSEFLILRISFLNFFFFIPGKKINTFDTTPNQFVSLIPNFWCWPLWKSAMFMHHDLAVLEQVL